MILKTHIFIIQISSFIGFFFVFISLILFILLMLKRLFLLRKQAKEKYLVTEWKAILLDSLYDSPASINNISKRNIDLFLNLWNKLQENLKGPEKEKLNQLADSINMNKTAMKMLSSRRYSKRLLAISILGNLRDEQAWDKLQEFSNSNNITLAISSIHALAKINPDRAVNILISFMVNSDGWPKYRISMLLNEVGADRYSKPLVKEILLLNSEKQSYLLSMMLFADGLVVLPLVKQLLATATDYEVISSCLNLIATFGDHRQISIIKKYLDHDVPYIRMNAVKALAFIGTEDELSYLEKCLYDKDWWVRYRAAEAIKMLPTMTYNKLLEIRDRQTDALVINLLNYNLK